MRYLPTILAKIFKPMPMIDAPRTEEHFDPISDGLSAAIAEHERVAHEVRDNYSARLKATVDDCLKRLDESR